MNDYFGYNATDIYNQKEINVLELKMRHMLQSYFSYYNENIGYNVYDIPTYLNLNMPEYNFNFYLDPIFKTEDKNIYVTEFNRIYFVKIRKQNEDDSKALAYNIIVTLDFTQTKIIRIIFTGITKPNLYNITEPNYLIFDHIYQA